MGAEQKATHIARPSSLVPRVLGQVARCRRARRCWPLSRLSRASLSLSFLSRPSLLLLLLPLRLCGCAWARSSHSYKPSGPLGSFEERYQVACFSPVGVVGAVTRRPALRVDDCYGWPIAHWRVSRSNGTQRWNLGKRWAACFHASVDVAFCGYSSLLLRPLFPNLLVTGVLSHACLGTCVF